MNKERQLIKYLNLKLTYALMYDEKTPKVESSLHKGLSAGNNTIP